MSCQRLFLRWSFRCCGFFSGSSRSNFSSFEYAVQHWLPFESVPQIVSIHRASQLLTVWQRGIAVCLL
jgi:hypothetical protein